MCGSANRRPSGPHLCHRAPGGTQIMYHTCSPGQIEHTTDAMLVQPLFIRCAAQSRKSVCRTCLCFARACAGASRRGTDLDERGGSCRHPGALSRSSARGSRAALASVTSRTPAFGSSKLAMSHMLGCLAMCACVCVHVVCDFVSCQAALLPICSLEKLEASARCSFGHPCGALVASWQTSWRR